MDNATVLRQQVELEVDMVARMVRFTYETGRKIKRIMIEIDPESKLPNVTVEYFSEDEGESTFP